MLSEYRCNYPGCGALWMCVMSRPFFPSPPSGAFLPCQTLGRQGVKVTWPEDKKVKGGTRPVTDRSAHHRRMANLIKIETQRFRSQSLLFFFFFFFLATTLARFWLSIFYWKNRHFNQMRMNPPPPPEGISDDLWGLFFTSLPSSLAGTFSGKSLAKKFSFYLISEVDKFTCNKAL